ncbi:hypothetical protein KSF_014100 [Reticulibacter mediterranei]|uniref:Uncharacterized protein n=1 Tax=Reticulibacter mediterranei TaxID=2778369 RepID=A0A8J3IH42_9CHLR|nr:hypothetical protein KSF_014100 [Reticulibacter mediterranei]
MKQAYLEDTYGFADDMNKMLYKYKSFRNCSHYYERCFIFANNKFRQCSSFDGIIVVATAYTSKFYSICGRVRGS